MTSLGCPTGIQAQIIITEVYPAPTSGEKEWIELYNRGIDAIDLHNWYLTDLLSTPAVIYTFFNSVLLPPNNYLILNLDVTKLNNTSDGVLLYNQAQVEINKMTYDSSETGKSWHYNLFTSTWHSDVPNPGSGFVLPSPTPTPTVTPTTTPTPTSPAPTPTPTATPTPTTIPFDTSVIKLSELHPCPTNSQPEWFEIYNSQSSVVTLSDWYILDAANHRFTFSATLGGNQYKVIELSTSLMNNSGDTITLYTKSGQALTTVTFGACQSDLSFSLSNNQWSFSDATPGQSNPLLKTSAGGSSPESTFTPASAAYLIGTELLPSPEAVISQSATLAPHISKPTYSGPPPLLISTVPLTASEAASIIAQNASQATQSALALGTSLFPTDPARQPIRKFISMVTGVAGIGLLSWKGWQYYQSKATRVEDML